MTANSANATRGKQLRAITFGAGGFDSAVHLGVTHALLVSHAAAPDYVAGLSAGAIQAAALAEVLKAGSSLAAAERQQAQIDSFRGFLASLLELPGDLLRSLLPDAYELKANVPLEPLALPIHFHAERQGRTAANRSRAGLIRLMNQLLDTRLPVSGIAVIANRLLRLVASGEEPSRGKRLWSRLRDLTVLWILAQRYLFALAPTVRALVWAAVAGASTTRRGAGLSAGQIIGRFVAIRRAVNALRDLLTIAACELSLLLGAPFVLAAFLWAQLPRRFRRRGRRPWLLDRILGHYEIADGLGNSYALRQLLVRCFDQEYFGRPDMAKILDKVLARSNEPAQADQPRKALEKKALEWYRSGEPAIVVAPIAAEVGTGDLRVLPSDVPVVDALLAANAVVPIFPAVKIESWAFNNEGSSEKYFIDGSNVSAEPVGALIGLLRNDERLDTAAGLDIYPVSNLVLDSAAGAAPDSIGTDGDGTGDGNGARELSGLLEVAARALDLQRFRDATIEQRLTKLYSNALPPTAPRVTIGGRRFVRAQVFPIALERATSINKHVFLGRADIAFKDLVYQAVADGCRASLEAMIPGAIDAVAAGEPNVSCLSAVTERLQGMSEPKLPGSGKSGPGLDEICRHCALHRSPGGEPPEDSRQRLKRRIDQDGRPDWPISGKPEPSRSDGTHANTVKIKIPDWPHSRNGLPGNRRPLISLLFGGGVFRGVFHMGVMNALNELGVEPDIVAGSSVGSIIAAMIAQAFTEDSQQRPLQIANLAATFLGIDRLVMTDRLAHFIRGLTLRAADAPFSLRDLDLVLRRYDFDSSRAWSARTRRVMAGLERFFYLSPLRLAGLIKAARERKAAGFMGLLGQAVQNFLDSCGVGQEILGAEPLALLIQQEVIRRLDPGATDKLFNAFAPHGIQFLATATNLSSGALDILGSPGPRCEDASLLHGLLASSAFPGVFRPRQSWEIFRSASDMNQYIDGGTIDNLPLDAVARFLDQAANGSTVARRPVINGRTAIPHLLFTASLEVDKTSLPDHDVETVRSSFMRLRRRAKTFSYNRKIDAYAAVQRNLREIHNSRLGERGYSTAWQPLDLHVIAVRPRWLCNTFGFHPMLGFRRRKQAESIAHGCASTISALFAESLTSAGAAWLNAWGIRGLEAVDRSAVTSQFDNTRSALNPRTQNRQVGQCWFRSVSCPFSARELQRHRDLAGRTQLIQELNTIYEACGRPETHRAAHQIGETVE